MHNYSIPYSPRCDQSDSRKKGGEKQQHRGIHNCATSVTPSSTINNPPKKPPPSQSGSDNKNIQHHPHYTERERSRPRPQRPSIPISSVPPVSFRCAPPTRNRLARMLPHPISISRALNLTRPVRMCHTHLSLLYSTHSTPITNQYRYHPVPRLSLAHTHTTQQPVPLPWVRRAAYVACGCWLGVIAGCVVVCSGEVWDVMGGKMRWGMR
jgi:hypothetical protein